jgi:hypothetical protein
VFHSPAEDHVHYPAGMWLIAAVLMTTPGLTSSSFIQALADSSLFQPAFLPTSARGSMDCRSLCYNALTKCSSLSVALHALANPRLALSCNAVWVLFTFK